MNPRSSQGSNVPMRRTLLSGIITKSEGREEAKLKEKEKSRKLRKNQNNLKKRLKRIRGG
jgi:hypothetical protein